MSFVNNTGFDQCWESQRLINSIEKLFHLTHSTVYIFGVFAPWISPVPDFYHRWDQFREGCAIMAFVMALLELRPPCVVTVWKGLPLAAVPEEGRRPRLDGPCASAGAKVCGTHLLTRKKSLQQLIMHTSTAHRRTHTASVIITTMSSDTPCTRVWCNYTVSAITATVVPCSPAQRQHDEHNILIKLLLHVLCLFQFWWLQEFLSMFLNWKKKLFTDCKDYFIC